MKWLWTTLPVVSLSLVVPALAQTKLEFKQDKPDVKQSAPETRPPKLDSKANISVSPGELAPTQDMWFYEQYQKQYTDPKTVVRQKAEFRGEERQRRIAALRWFGFSNQRPSACADPVNTDMAPHWTSGNINLPSRWSGGGTATIVAKPALSGRLY